MPSRNITFHSIIEAGVTDEAFDELEQMTPHRSSRNNSNLSHKKGISRVNLSNISYDSFYFS